jgi:hypothetical protein
MVIISYGTKTPVRYKEAALSLRNNIVSLGMRGNICILSDLGSRKRNTLRKARFILDKLKEDVLWVDVDSKILSKITLSWDFDIGYVEIPRKGHNIISAILAVKNSPGGKNFLKRWASLCEEDFESYDHGRMLMAMEEKCRYKNITEELCGKIIVNVGTKREIIL